MRSRIYKYFIVFFFFFALSLSACRTLKVTGEVDENQDTINPVAIAPNDSVVEKNIVADTSNAPVVNAKKNTAVVRDSVMKNDSVVPQEIKQETKPETKLRSEADK